MMNDVKQDDVHKALN